MNRRGFVSRTLALLGGSLVAEAAAASPADDARLLSDLQAECERGFDRVLEGEALQRSTVPDGSLGAGRPFDGLLNGFIVPEAGDPPCYGATPQDAAALFRTGFERLFPSEERAGKTLLWRKAPRLFECDTERRWLGWVVYARLLVVSTPISLSDAWSQAYTHETWALSVSFEVDRNDPLALEGRSAA